MIDIDLASNHALSNYIRRKKNYSRTNAHLLLCDSNMALWHKQLDL